MPFLIPESIKLICQISPNIYPEICQKLATFYNKSIKEKPEVYKQIY